MLEFKNYKRRNEMISLDMILIDEKGTLIHIVIWKNQVNKFRDKLSEGFLIIIRNFKVIEIIGEYRPIQSDLKIKWKKRDIHILTTSGPYIVIVTATVKKFKGEITFTITTTIKTYVNLTMDNITSLIHKFATNFVHIKTIDSANTSNIPMEEKCMVTLRAQITEIANFFDWYYIVCNLCYKNIEPTAVYKIHIKVKDNDEKTTLVLFNGVAENFLDTSAFKLFNRLYKSDTHEFVFKLNLSNFNLKEGLENYTMTKVYASVEELKLQHCINKDKKGEEGGGASSCNTRVYARKMK
ncbi:hypothetical protein R3W88_011780 [Solanum pinnatisectum]|uniref:Replication protein A 70 kDa DNA-binding subunit B/D first OB fold domain-containing protein n=1 Tax=Solanum pinnatisectum TaxID=50273 RepID=A0AAV9L8E8_9SOLN|nr:hypothetical protein R3W88_011780 [Solanum pinnatisectum]